MTKEDDVRKQVKSLKRFYMDGIVFAVVNSILILVWLTMDTGSIFWPKYVLLVWGIALLFKAYKLGGLTFFSHHLYFLTSEWEEKKIKELTRDHQDQRRIQLHQSRKR